MTGREVLNPQEKIMVTGNTGFIGSHLMARFKEQHREIAVFSLEHKKDIRDFETVIALPQTDVVFHLAAQANVAYSFEHPHETLDTNIRGVLNALEWCRQRKTKMVFASTAYVYGSPQELPIPENHPLDGPNAYVESKIIGERLCRLYATKFDSSVIVLRFFNIYGPGQRTGVIPDMIDSLLNQGFIEFRSGVPKRDFVFIDDVVEALLKAGEFEPQEKFAAFNIGSGQSFSIRQVANNLRKIAGGKIEIIDRHQARPGDVREIVADITRAKQVLDWQPKTSFEEGLKKTYLAAKRAKR